MNVVIPDGLGDLLRDFTVAVLKEKPKDLYEFAADWFVYTRDTHRMRNIPLYIIADDDEDSSPKSNEAERVEPKIIAGQGRTQRRHSVSAERYDPEQDEDDSVIIHKKTDEQRKRLSDVISKILLFKSLDTDQIKRVIDVMFEKKVEAGEKVIKQGEDGDNFYVIDHGVFDVFTKVDNEEKKVYRFENSGSFGELALMYNMPRSATIQAVSEGSLWAMDRSSFQSIVMKSAFKKRKMYEELLESVPLLQSLEEYERMNIADALVTMKFQDGECIVRQGGEADGMYFIESGKVRITLKKEGKELEVAHAERGQYFGEAALIDNNERTASVYAVGPVTLAFLESECFERLMGPCLDSMKKNMVNYKRK